jgi:hypothetical protein
MALLEVHATLGRLRRRVNRDFTRIHSIEKLISRCLGENKPLRQLDLVLLSGITFLMSDMSINRLNIRRHFVEASIPPRNG